MRCSAIPTYQRWKRKCQLRNEEISEGKEDGGESTLRSKTSRLNACGELLEAITTLVVIETHGSIVRTTYQHIIAVHGYFMRGGEEKEEETNG